MNEMERFEALAAWARRETPPRAIVAASVSRSIQKAYVRRIDDLPFIIGSAVSALAASVAIVVAAEGWTAMTDPLLNLFDAFYMVMQ